MGMMMRRHREVREENVTKVAHIFQAQEEEAVAEEVVAEAPKPKRRKKAEAEE